MRKRLQRPFNGAEISAIRREILDDCQAQGLPNSLGWDLVSTADELLCNVWEHSRADWVDFEMNLDPARGTAHMVIRDNGRGFDFEAAVARAEEAAGNGTNRKMGLMLVKRTVDEMRFRRRPEGINELTLELSVTGSNNRLVLN